MHFSTSFLLERVDSSPIIEENHKLVHIMKNHIKKALKQRI